MIVAGFGFRSGVQRHSLKDAFAKARRVYDVDLLATLDTKSAGIEAFAVHLGIPLIKVTRSQMTAQKGLTHSAAAEAVYGVGSVAETVALAAAGDGAVLLAPRVIAEDGMATCALARGEEV